MRALFENSILISALFVAIFSIILMFVNDCKNKIFKIEYNPYSSIISMMLGILIGSIIVFW